MTDWRAIAKAKAESVNALIQPEWRLKSIPTVNEERDVTGHYIQQFLTEREVEITESDAVDIVGKTTTGQWTAVEVTKAFCHRAALAHQLVSCLHEIFFEAALVDAEQLDKYYAEHHRPIGPLHGLPVSLKDQFHVKGVETHMGFTGWIGTFEGRKGTGLEKVFESEMVRELRQLGAVLFCKTSVPQTLMCGETVNNIIDYTWNPTNRNLSSGGSSGGEGALIALRGSPAGFGTDIGGSIRIPAGFNGSYGLRPSTGRLPYQGMANSSDGQNIVLSVVGPLATTPRALKLLTQSILSTQPWLHDPLVHEMPWRPTAELAITEDMERAQNGLSFGVLRNDGGRTPHPPVARAIETVVKALQTKGHKVIDWSPTPSHSKLSDLCLQAWYADGNADSKKQFDLSGEDIASNVLFEIQPQLGATDLMAVTVAKREAQKEYMEYWNSTSVLTGLDRPVDAVICPLAPFAAARPGRFSYYTYTSFVNLLDYTTVVIPVLKVDKGIDKKNEGFRPLNDADKEVQDDYDPEIYDGAHVAIQLVGRRLQEEKMIAVAEYVSSILNG